MLEFNNNYISSVHLLFAYAVIIVGACLPKHLFVQVLLLLQVLLESIFPFCSSRFLEGTFRFTLVILRWTTFTYNQM